MRKLIDINDRLAAPQPLGEGGRATLLNEICARLIENVPQAPLFPKAIKNQFRQRLLAKGLDLGQ